MKGSKENLLSDIGSSDRSKPLFPQLFAAAAVATFYINIGFTFGYGVVVVPQLLDEQNCTDCRNVLKVTKEDTAWLVSIIKLMTPIGAIIGGFGMDFFGRLNLLRMTTIPTIIGWVLLATSNCKSMLFLGRLLTGFLTAWATAVPTYISEISSPEMRGSLIAITYVFVSLGMLITFVEGSFLHWRLVAWTCSIIVVVPALLVMLLHESPSWLVLKNHLGRAHASLQWFHRDSRCIESKSQQETLNQELQQLIEKNITKQIHQTSLRKSNVEMYMRMFVRPTFYKPMLIMLGLMFLQQASGTYIIMLYAILFIKNSGTTINPYHATICLGVMRFLMSITNIWLSKMFNRRSLLFFSTTGMCISLSASAVYTRWLLQGTSDYQWIIVIFLMTYCVSAMAGLSTLPYTIMGEVFPLEIRGVSQNIVFTAAGVMTFGAIRSYYALNDFFGPSGLQFFFATMCLLALFYCYAFVPETHRKTLSDIENCFKGRSNHYESTCNGGTIYGAANNLQIGLRT